MRRWLLSLCALATAATTQAQWNPNPTENNLVISAAKAPFNKFDLVGVSDLAGNAFFAWTETRGSSKGIFVQKVNADGTLAFDSAASPIYNLAASGGPGDISNLEIIPDLQGGVIIIWTNNPESNDVNIYGQRVNALGVPIWETTGKLLFAGAAGVNQLTPKITLLSNASEFALVWRENRAAPSGIDLYAQKYLVSDGSPVWANELTLVSAAGIQSNASVWPDGFGGFIAVWQDARVANTAIYGQRVNSAGTKLWGTPDPTDGLRISDDLGRNEFPSIVTDGASGILVAFQSTRISTLTDIFAQRVSAAGERLSQDVPICIEATAIQRNARIMLSGSNVIIGWEDNRNAISSTPNYDIYAQSINLGSAIPSVNWASNGEPVIMAANAQASNALYIVPDGDGGGVFIWDDSRAGTASTAPNSRFDIYAQRLNAITGNPMWAADGAPVATRTGSNQSHPVVAPFSANNSIIVGWRDNRSTNTVTTTQEIYASQINLDGTLPVTLLDFNAVPAGGKITTKWQTTDEFNSREFIVEKSGDGINYHAIGSVKAKNTSGKNNYTFDDLRPLAGDNFYRLRAVDIDNRFEYSRIARVSMLRKLPAQVFAYPNPAADMLKLQFNNFEKGVYQVRMVDVRGAVIMSRSMSVDAGLQQAEFSMSNLAAGRYFMQVIGNGRVISVQPVQKL